MIEFSADNNYPENFQLFFENQNVTSISKNCYVSENPNIVTKGWIEVFVFNKDGKKFFKNNETLAKIYSDTVENVTAKIYGSVHWSNCKNDTEEILDHDYTVLQWDYEKNENNP